jgi:demethylmenaquinone methyltransferase/2-methoxy-6-polyprenyl-1,4-benzoquinol methylase
MARVTEPGGRVAILELTEPRGGLIAPFSRAWCRHAVPVIGALLSGAREYRYLQSSVAAFPPAAEFVEMMRANALEPIDTVSMGMGACTLFVARPGGSIGS